MGDLRGFTGSRSNKRSEGRKNVTEYGILLHGTIKFMAEIPRTDNYHIMKVHIGPFYAPTRSKKFFPT